MTAAR